MKYQSEIIHEILGQRGHEKSSLHYQSECIETWIEETKGSYPKLCDYESEWLNYIIENPIGEFPYITLTDETEATVENVVPYAYKSAILKGNTKYRDIDTGDILDTFDETKNLELVSVKMPVLTTIGKNLFDKTKTTTDKLIVGTGAIISSTGNAFTDYIRVEAGKTYIRNIAAATIAVYDNDKNFIERTKAVTTFTATANGYIRCNFNSYASVLDTMQVEEGSTTTSYEPYKSNILTVNEDVTLRGFGNVQDEMDLTTGKLTQRIGEIVLNGSENWKAQSFTAGTNQFLRFCLGDVSNCKENAKALCDKEKVMEFDHVNEDYIRPSTNLIWIYRKDLTTTVEDLKQQLQANPYTVQYELAEPVIKTVDLSVVDENGNEINHFIPIEGTMHIQTDGEPIKPSVTMEIPVEAITQNLASFIEGE